MWSESQQVPPLVLLTCTSGKKVYIKSIIVHADGGGSIEWHGDSSLFYSSRSNVLATTRLIFDIDVVSGETILLEPSYPIVLERTEIHSLLEQETMLD